MTADSHRDHPAADEDCTCDGELEYKHNAPHDGAVFCLECDTVVFSFP